MDQIWHSLAGPFAGSITRLKSGCPWNEFSSEALEEFPSSFRSLAELRSLQLWVCSLHFLAGCQLGAILSSRSHLPPRTFSATHPLPLLASNGTLHLSLTLHTLNLKPFCFWPLDPDLKGHLIRSCPPRLSPYFKVNWCGILITFSKSLHSRI